MRKEKSQTSNRRQKPPLTLYLILLILAIVSAIGLDFIRAKKGQKAYFFPPLDRKEPPSVSPALLGKNLIESLSAAGIKADSIDQFQDTKGMDHITVDLPLQKYRELAPLLESKLFQLQASVVKEEKPATKEKLYFLWEVKSKKGEIFFVHFFTPFKEKQEKKPLPPPSPRKKVAIIVDDIGYNLETLKELYSLNKTLTIAVLPYSPWARESAEMAHAHNLEVILHLPLESLNNIYDNNHTNGIILSEMDKSQIIKKMEDNLKQIPFIAGVNTHMGSKITADPNLMRIILEELKGKNLYFIDSRTTARSIAFESARQIGIPSAYRHVFLDGQLDEDYIKNQLLELFRKARKNGKAIGICHPSGQTIKVLKENLALASDYGLELVYASQVVE